MLAQLAVAEAYGYEPEQEHDGEHDLDAGIAEAQRGGAHVTAGRCRSSKTSAPRGQSWLRRWTRSRRRLAAKPILWRSSRFFSGPACQPLSGTRRPGFSGCIASGIALAPLQLEARDASTRLCLEDPQAFGILRVPVLSEDMKMTFSRHE